MFSRNVLDNDDRSFGDVMLVYCARVDPCPKTAAIASDQFHFDPEGIPARDRGQGLLANLLPSRVILVPDPRRLADKMVGFVAQHMMKRSIRPDMEAITDHDDARAGRV